MAQTQKRFGYRGQGGWATRLLSGAITFVAVTVAWVFFRADSATTAFNIIKSMTGLNGFALPEKYLIKFSPLATQLEQWGVSFRHMHFFQGSNEVVYIAVALLIVWFAPNVQQMMGSYVPYLNIMAKEKELPKPSRWLTWKPSYFWAAVCVICALVSILFLSRASEFIYFQF